MNNTRFEELMREGEAYHAARLPRDHWIVLRVDGHGFSRLTEAHFQKPFDPTFHECMVKTAQALLEEFDALYAYTESDEISVLLPANWAMFDRSHEKAISISAGIASSVFTLSSGHLARFDSRVWLGEEEAQVTDYFRWRQSDAARCALNGWCYWTLRQKGHSANAATTMLKGQSSEFKRELLREYGADFERAPSWQRHGVGLYRETYAKDGYNPQTQKAVTTGRRRTAVNSDLAVGEDYAIFVRNLMQSGCLVRVDTDGDMSEDDV